MILEEHRCGRPTLSTRNACRALRLFPFAACVKHLNDEERTTYETEKAKWRAHFQPYRQQRTALLLGDPACWSWPVPGEDLASGDEYEDARRLSDWQKGRCAICGIVDQLVNDHDHQTGLVRGRLCRPCNTSEGFDGRPGTVFERYRQRPPTSMLRIRLRYWDPIAKAFAQPERQIEDGWEDNSTADLT